MNYTQNIIKIIVIFISLIYPFILWSIEGELNSLSQYWNTSLQPLFILANVMTAYFFFTLDDWKISSVLLVLVTSFSVKLYPNIHNLVAVLFFISCLFPIYKSKRYKFYFYLYMVSPIIGIFWGLLYLEIYSIIVLCSYHLHSIIHVMTVLYQKHKLEE
jgi:hypothetical protein